MQIKAGFGKKIINITARKLSESEMFSGLMFKSRKSDNLLFEKGGRWAIHSWFVFFPFLALWLDKKNKIIEHKIVRPFSFYVKPARKFAKLIEIPLNDSNKNLLAYFSVDGERFK